MVSTENGENENEIREEPETSKTDTGMTLRDYIPIYIPTVERGLIDQTHHEKRFLDFLKAQPSNDWFLKFGFVGRLSPFSFLRRNANQSDESSDPPPGGGRRRFRVPFVRKINREALIKYFKNWIKNPVNMALLVWLFFVAAGLLLLFLVWIGILNGVITKSSKRKRWSEIINQILNALFTIMCLYQHPKLFHHFVLLCRWKLKDAVELRKVYSKNGARKPHEWAHMMFVVFLLHITCFAQYALCGLYWGYTRKTRPDYAETLCIAVGIAAPIIAFLYTIFSPLGRKSESEAEEEAQRQEAIAANLDHGELKLYDRRVVVTSPEWIGGLFDCCDDPTVCCTSSFCVFCVFGWNMERLGFGNMYVHIVTFILLCVAPFLVFAVTALNVDADVIWQALGIVGIVLGIFGFFYGGFWRIQMRKKFKLPGNPFCCGYPSMTDFMQWLFCWPCSLSQEVRTGNFYDIEEDSFYRIETDENGRVVMLPLPREGWSWQSLDSTARSLSCPPNFGDTNSSSYIEMAKKCSSIGLPISIDRDLSTYGEDHTMSPPLPPLIQLEDHRSTKN